MRLLVAVDSPSKCEAVFRALKVEAMSNALAKDTVTLTRRGKSLSLALQADGIPALRALMNSYGRWFSSIIKTFEKLGSEGKS